MTFLPEAGLGGAVGLFPSASLGTLSSGEYSKKLLVSLT